MSSDNNIKKPEPVESFPELRNIIGDFHKVGTEKIKTPSGDYYNGFAMKASEIEQIIDFLNKNKKDSNRVFFSFAFHVNEAHGLPSGSYSLVASPMVLDEATGNYVVPYSYSNNEHYTNFDYCEPCPHICPKFADSEGNLIDIRDL